MYIKELIWDSWNIAHIARHSVVPSEVEQVCHGSYVTYSTYGERIMVIGLSKKKRVLAIVLAPKGKGVYYPVTARSADKKEKQQYEEQKGGVRV